MDGVVEIKLEPLDTVEESQNESKNEASKDNAAIWIKREPVDGEDVPMKPPDSTQCTVKVEPNDALTAKKLNQALDEALPDGSSSKEEKPEASEENESSDTQPKSMASRKRVSVRQIELLVEFLEGHRDLARGRLKSKEASALSSRLWAECAGILNAETDDDQRTAKQWNKWYTDYKCRLLSRIRQIKSNLSSTAGGPGISILLSPLEERLASLLGANMEVTGRTGAPQDEVQINPLSPVLHTASSSPAPALPFECGENGHNITNEYEVVDVAHFPSTQSIESEQVNETIPTRQRTRRLSRLNRQSPPASSELEASSNKLAAIEKSRTEVEKMMATACQTMAEATNKMAEAALKSAEAQGRIAEALENISKALLDKHVRWRNASEEE